MVLCAMLRAKQTKFELLYAPKCQKSLKTHKIATKHVISTICLIFNSNHFNTIIYTNECCVPCCVQNKQSLSYFMCESAKKA